MYPLPSLVETLHVLPISKCERATEKSRFTNLETLERSIGLSLYYVAIHSDESSLEYCQDEQDQL